MKLLKLMKKSVINPIKLNFFIVCHKMINVFIIDMMFLDDF